MKTLFKIEDIYFYQPADELYSILHNDFSVEQNKAIQVAYYDLSDQEVNEALDWFKNYLTNIGYKEFAPNTISNLLIESILKELCVRLINHPGLSNVEIYFRKYKTETTYLGQLPVESEWSQGSWHILADWECTIEDDPWLSARHLVYNANLEIKKLTGKSAYLRLESRENYE